MPDDVVKLKSSQRNLFALATLRGVRNARPLPLAFGWRIAGATPADVDTIDGFRYISLCYTAFQNDDPTIARIFTLI
jgi:hypothetical protein